MSTASLEQITIEQVEAYANEASIEDTQAIETLPCGCKVHSSRI